MCSFRIIPLALMGMLVTAATGGAFAQTPVPEREPSAAPTVPPPNFNGGDVIFEIAGGTLLRSGPSANDAILYTVWRRVTAHGRGACTEAACPVRFNGHDVFSPREKLTVARRSAAHPSSVALDDVEYPAGWQRLRVGDKGDAVRQLQELLVKDGARLETDGTYGRATEAAVRDLQRRWNMEVDGVAGRRTLYVLGVIEPPDATPNKAVASF